MSLLWYVSSLRALQGFRSPKDLQSDASDGQLEFPPSHHLDVDHGDLLSPQFVHGYKEHPRQTMSLRGAGFRSHYIIYKSVLAREAATVCVKNGINFHSFANFGM